MTDQQRASGPMSHWLADLKLRKNVENLLVKMVTKEKQNTKSCLQMFEKGFQAIISFFNVAKPFLQGVGFSNTD